MVDVVLNTSADTHPYIHIPPILFSQISLHATSEGRIADIESKASKTVEVVTTGSMQETQKLRGELRTVFTTLSTHTPSL